MVRKLKQLRDIKYEKIKQVKDNELGVARPKLRQKELS